MKNNSKHFEKKMRFSIRKLSIGCVSCLIGCAFMFSNIQSTSLAADNSFAYSSTLSPENQQELNKLVEELKNVNYTDNEIKEVLKPGYISPINIINKKLEITNSTGKPFKDITDDEAKNEIIKEYLIEINLGDAFNSNKNNLPHLLSMITSNNNFYKVRENKYQILVGLAYMTRYYDINIGNKNIRDELLNTPNPLNDKSITLTNLVNDSSKGRFNFLTASNTPSAFRNYVHAFTKYEDIPSLLKGIANENSIENINDWFKDTSKAIIIETPSSTREYGDYKVFDKLSKLEENHKFILSLLTVPENSIYVLTNPTTISFGMQNTYSEKGEELKKILNSAAKQQGEFLDFWRRIAKSNLVKFLDANNRIGIDTMRIDDGIPTTHSQEEWSKRVSESNDKGISHFITPLGLYAKYFGANAVAEGENIRYYKTKAISDDGLSAYGHELTHRLDEKVWLNGFGRRDGLDVEFFARGLYETYVDPTNTPIININTIVDRNDSFKKGIPVYTNKSPNRFVNETDLKNYMSGVFDVINLLDKYEAEIILSKNNNELKKNWFNKIEESVDTRARNRQGGGIHKVENFLNISDDDANSLHSIDDLVDKNIVAARYEFKGRDRIGKSISNDYLVLPLFSPMYAAIANDQGVTGDIMARRIAHELLAEFGYHNGMVPYLSNQYKTPGNPITDIQVLTKIFNGKYKNVKEWKKNRYKQADLKEIKPITVTVDDKKIDITSKEDLKLALNEAIEKDIQYGYGLDGWGYRTRLPYNTNVEKLKSAIYREYLHNKTDEFRSSIYLDTETKTGINKFTTTYIADSNLEYNSKVDDPANPGVDGEYTYEVENGVEKKDTRKTTKEMQPKIIKVGNINIEKTETPIETEYVLDTNRDYGTAEVTVNEGSKGIKEIEKTYTVDSSNGSLGEFTERTVTNKDMVKKVVSKGGKTKKTVEAIKFTKIEENDSSIPSGTRTKVKEGKNGEKVTTITYSIDSKTGVVTENTHSIKITDPQPEIWKVGTMPTTPPDTPKPKPIDPPSETNPTNQPKIEKGVINFTTIFEADSSLKFKEHKEDPNQTGINGEYTYEVENGSEKEGSRKIIKNMQPKVVKVGNIEIIRIDVPIETKYVLDENRDKDTPDEVKEGILGFAETIRTYVVNSSNGSLENFTTTAGEKKEMVKKIISKGAKPKVSTEEIPFNIVKVNDPTILIGNIVKIDGKKGIKRTTIKYSIDKDGSIIENEKSEITQNPVDEIWKIGTKQPERPITPPSDNTTPPANNEPVVPPSDNTTPPANNEPVVPPSDNTTPPANNEPVVPPSDNTTPPVNNEPVVPPSDNTTSPVNNEPVVPPGDNTKPKKITAVPKTAPVVETLPDLIIDEPRSPGVKGDTTTHIKHNEVSKNPPVVDSPTYEIKEISTTENKAKVNKMNNDTIIKIDKDKTVKHMAIESNNKKVKKLPQTSSSSEIAGVVGLSLLGLSVYLLRKKSEEE